MGYLFENMEKMDIQEERRKTADAFRKLEDAQRQAEDAQRQVEEAHDQVEEMRNEAIRSIVLICQKLGGAKRVAVQELMAVYGIDQSAAMKNVERYWKDEA